MKRYDIFFLFAMLTVSMSLDAHAGCRWAGTAPFCRGKCNSNEIMLERRGGLVFVPYGEAGEPNFGSKCASGTKALCCTRCPSGLVWREAKHNRFDTVCVTPAERTRASQ